MATKGYFKPRNPQKYRGNPTNIIFRSSWEFSYMSYLDRHPHVVQWASEEFFIPYRKYPGAKKLSRYYPDFWVQYKNANGSMLTEIIEVKPFEQTKPPKRPPANKRTRRFLNECITYGINNSKWEAAQSYAKARGWKFRIVTEKELYG